MRYLSNYILISFCLSLLTAVRSQSNSSSLPVGSCTSTIPCSNGACCNGDSGFCGIKIGRTILNLSLQNSARHLDVNPTATPPRPHLVEAKHRVVNFAFALLSDTFTIIEMSPGDAALWTRTTALKKNNVALKVFLSIGGWSFNDPPTSNIFSDLVGSDANTAAFITSTLNTLQAYGFDGIDVDWEYPAAYDRGGAPADKANYVTFMSKVKAAFKPRGYGLTFTAPSSFWYLQHFDLPGLMQYADWVNIMTYDLHGTWDGKDPYIGPLVLAHTNLTEISLTLSLFNNVGVNPSQIVLGIGFYGRSFQLADPSCSSPGCEFVGGAAPGPCSANSGTLMFSEIEAIITQNGLQPTFDEVAAVKYITWNNDQWVSYDDAQTLQMKMNYANSRCLGGGCGWVGDLPNCLNSACKAGQVGIFSDIQGDASQSCVGDGRRLYCCDPPANQQFLPVPEQWVLPSVDPAPGGHEVIQPATFTVDFDDNIGTSDGTQHGAGSSGESDDGKENDSPFGEVFISSPNPGSVSSLDLNSDWVIHGCDRSSDQAQEVLAYCSKSMDSGDSGCGHVFIGQAEHTVIRLPTTCGLGPYARVVSLAPHEDQSILPTHIRRELPDSELVYSLKFDYNFAVIPDNNGPILMRADVTDMPGYWDEMINSPPDDGTTSTKRSNNKRDFHQPEGLERRWFGPFDRWLEKLNTVKNGNSLSRNFHWSDTSCPNFSSSLDISVTGTAQANSRFGYYLEATIIPPAIQQCYVYLNAGASAQATFTITGLAEAHFGTERAEIISFGFPGVGLLTLGPSLHLYGELTGKLSMSGTYSTSVGYEFPSIDLSFGKQDKNTDEENTGSAVDPNANNNGFDYSFGYNVNLEGNVEVSLPNSATIFVLTLSFRLISTGGVVLDAQIFTEADIYAGVGITGSVSNSVAPEFCVNPYFGVDLNAGLTGSVLFWRDNTITTNFYSKQFPFGGACFTSADQASGNSRRDDIISGNATSGSPLRIPIPAYDRTPIIAYYDLADPNSLDPSFGSWSPRVPINLGLNDDGDPYLTSLFVDYLELAEQQDLWLDSTGNRNAWCTWVTTHLNSNPPPSYYPPTFGGKSVFGMINTCYPHNPVVTRGDPGTPMAILEQNANVIKRVAFLSMEAKLNKVTASPVRTPATFKGYCPQKQVEVLRSAAGVPSFLNEYEVSSIFIDMNNCVRDVWSQWARAYQAGNSGVDAPNRANINVVNIYDDWIYRVVENVPIFIRAEVQKLIPLYNKGQTTAATVDLSWPALLDEAKFQKDRDGTDVKEDASVYQRGVQVTQADLTAQIFNKIQDINWLNFLPKHF
ncbi:hypothetical protein DFH09DRAFT_1249584 [Mycena vulgaris]|nr:hypothetical protein DFH09DRAFT_1249584 [Mycena vulgaris]